MPKENTRPHGPHKNGASKGETQKNGTRKLGPVGQATEPLKMPSTIWFVRFAQIASLWLGSSWVFLAACALIIGWALTGPLFDYSQNWQLLINTGTTIITFLMVFLIQNTQNRDARAIHLKLDELIRAMKGAEDEMINVEHLSDEKLEELSKKYEAISKEREARSKRTGRTPARVK